jgi:hypothetical protein
MMRLDEQANEFVVPLARGERRHMDPDEATVFTSWATKTALMRTLQDAKQSQQARPERFHSFYANRSAFGELVVQAAWCDRRHMDNNQSWVNPTEESAISNVVAIAMGCLFVQVGIFPPEDRDHELLTRAQLAAVRHLTHGKVQIVRAGRRWEAAERVTDTEMAMAREPAALIGAAPAIENALTRVPIKQLPGGSFGNPYRVPDVNDIPWQTYE